MFLFLELIAFLIFFLNPIYPTIIYVISALFGLYLVYKLPPTFVFSRKFWLLLLLLVPFLLIPIATANPDYEAVHTYQSLFDTLGRGDNPYISGTIYHRVGGSAVYGNFNYPPLEIPFYWFTYLMSGAWSVWVMILVNLLVRALVCVVFMKTTPELRQIQRLPFYSIFLLFGSGYPITMTFLIVALLMYYIPKKIPTGKKATSIRYLPFLFALGLLTKFFVVPIFFAFYYHHFFDMGERKGTVKHLILVGVVATLLLLPFGITDVFSNTVLFNLNLGQRAAYTTFYPNIFSAFFNWFGGWRIYALLAGGVFVSALYFFDENPFTKIVYTCMAFMILIPTPEPQFLAILFYVVVVSKYAELSGRVSLTSSPSSKGRQIPSQ